jgi:quinol monooxygenase YgiN
MRRVMVRYRVRPDQAAANEELVRAVYDELGSVDPGGLRYATFVLEDGVTFVHVAQIESDDGRNPVTELPTFRRFVETVRERCEEPPVTSELREVGSYRLEAV